MKVTLLESSLIVSFCWSFGKVMCPFLLPEKKGEASEAGEEKSENSEKSESGSRRDEEAEIEEAVVLCCFLTILVRFECWLVCHPSKTWVFISFWLCSLGSWSFVSDGLGPWGGNLWVVWPPKYFKCQVGDANVEASETGSNPNELPDLPEDLEEEPFASLHPSLRIWRLNDREISLRIWLGWCFGFHYTSCCELIHSAAWAHGPFLHGICQGGTKDADKDTNHARPQSPKSGHAQFDSIIHHWTDALVVECSVKWSRCACGKSAVCGVSKISKGWGWGRRTVNSSEQWCCWLFFKSRVHQRNIGII